MHRGYCLLLAVALFLMLGAKQAEKSYWAERFDVTADVMKGGDLQVHERVVFTFQGGPFTYVFRELPTQATDGIVDIQARVDGQTLEEGNGPGQVEIVDGDPIRITWHMEPTSDAIRSFDLYYRILGLARQKGNADQLWWRPLPVAHEYAIASSQTVVRYPPLWRLAAEPSVEQGSALVTVDSGRVTFIAHGLAADESLTIMIPFQGGILLSDQPRLEIEAQGATRRGALQESQQASWSWVWLVLGGLILAAGIGLLYQALAPFQRPKYADHGLAYRPPGDLPTSGGLAPALVGALRSSSARVTWVLALSTLFDLAGRGFLAIEQLPKRRWTGKDFLIRRTDSRPSIAVQGLRPHEAGVIALLLADKHGVEQESVKVSQLNNLIRSRRWKRFEKSVEAELIAAGLVNEERRKARSGTMAMALIPMLFALIVALIVLLFHSAFGWWPLIAAAALLLVTILWLIGGATISVLSDEGALTAAEWEPFYHYLKAVSNGQAAPANDDEFETHLPYATAYGLLHSWARRFEKDGWTQTPAYFRPLQNAGQPPMAAFVAMTAATSSSGGSASAGAAGAAGSAGAAGGGASGAG